MDINKNMDFLPKINYTYVAVAIIVVILLVYLYKRKTGKASKEKMSQKSKSKVPVLDEDKVDDDDSEEDKVESLAKSLHKKLHKGFVSDNMDIDKFNKIAKNKVSPAVFTELTTLYNDLRDKDEDLEEIGVKDYKKIVTSHIL